MKFLVGEEKNTPYKNNWITFNFHAGSCQSKIVIIDSSQDIDHLLFHWKTITPFYIIPTIYGAIHDQLDWTINCELSVYNHLLDHLVFFCKAHILSSMIGYKLCLNFVQYIDECIDCNASICFTNIRSLTCMQNLTISISFFNFERWYTSQLDSCRLNHPLPTSRRLVRMAARSVAIQLSFRNNWTCNDRKKQWKLNQYTFR